MAVRIWNTGKNTFLLNSVDYLPQRKQENVVTKLMEILVKDTGEKGKLGGLCFFR